MFMCLCVSVVIKEHRKTKFFANLDRKSYSQFVRR